MKTKTKEMIALLLALLMLVCTVTAAADSTDTENNDTDRKPTVSAADTENKNGDINLDGRVDTTDAIVLKRHFLSVSLLSDAQAAAADLDGNGQIDSTDYILLKRIILGINGHTDASGQTGVIETSSAQTGGTVTEDQTTQTTSPGTTVTESDTSLTSETAAATTETTQTPYSPTAVYKLSYNNITNISKKKNVFVFVIDRFDRVFAEAAFMHDPTVFSSLKGFTYFEDNLALYGHTYPSIAYMITGNKFGNQIRKEYLTNVYYAAGTLKELKENKYQVNVYTSTYFGYIAGNSIGKYISNVVDTKKSNKEYVTTLNTLEEFYADAEFRLVDNKVFSFIHLEGCHDCYFGGGTPPEKLKEAQVEKALTALKRNFAIINKYIDNMKEWGVYEDATIIITGDHGSAISDTRALDGIRTTALFVKPSGSGSGDVVRSSAQVCHDNLWATIFKSEGINTENDYGASVFEIPADAEMTRFYQWHMFGKDPETEKSFYIDYKYTITGSALDFNNWAITEEKKYDRSVYS